MIEQIFVLWLLAMGGILAAVILYAVITFPFRALTSIGSEGWSTRAPIIIFSRKTWSWLLPSAKVK